MKINSPSLIVSLIFGVFLSYKVQNMCSAVDPNCIFCKIIEGKEPAEVLYQDDEVMVFKDIKPASKLHFLTIPKTHIQDAKHLTSKDIYIVEKMYETAKRIIIEKGYKLDDTRFGYHWPPFNSIKHLHLHAIAPESEMGLIARTVFMKNSYWFVSPEYVRSRL